MNKEKRVRAFQDFAEISDLIQRFESARLPRKEWDHRAHLCVALWYMYHLEEHDAARRMIRGIRRYNHANGIVTTPTEGYHETLTLFWLAVVRAFLRSERRRCRPGVLVLANALVERYGERRGLASEFYSDAVLWSSAARTRWVPPDVRPLSALTGSTAAYAPPLVGLSAGVSPVTRGKLGRETRSTR